ncbi:MAG: hypothetical protein E7379_04015 [Clostridiales bacterium]|nr:hypothetical protein [Clostridiales bacterium]
MKTFDIRKIYVCQIQEVKNLFEEQTDEDEVVYLNGRRLVIGKKIRGFYELDENNVSYGLFVKRITGYKHILTGSKYREATNPSISIGEHVINPKHIELLTKKERALTSHLIANYQSYDMDLSVIKVLEERINDDAKYIEENEETLGK